MLAAEDGGEIELLLHGRLHSPVGLDLGGDDEAAIALAVAAEIQRTRHARTAGSCRLGGGG
jgi:xanthine/CO dehydrogenase XdhC/CoxF family maturation factor